MDSQQARDAIHNGVPASDPEPALILEAEDLLQGEG